MAGATSASGRQVQTHLAALAGNLAPDFPATPEISASRRQVQTHLAALAGNLAPEFPATPEISAGRPQVQTHLAAPAGNSTVPRILRFRPSAGQCMDR